MVAVLLFLPLLLPFSRPHPRARFALKEVCEMAVAVAAYSADFGAYPPDDITLVGGTAEFGGSEALVYHLSRPVVTGGKRVGPYFCIEEGRLTDEDGDGFKEFRDPWGGPYLYGRPDDRLHPGWPRPFDLASPGPDGLLGGEMVPGKGYVPATTPEGKAAERDNITNW